MTPEQIIELVKLASMYHMRPEHRTLINDAASALREMKSIETATGNTAEEAIQNLKVKEKLNRKGGKR